MIQSNSYEAFRLHTVVHSMYSSNFQKCSFTAWCGFPHCVGWSSGELSSARIFSSSSWKVTLANMGHTVLMEQAEQADMPFLMKRTLQHVSPPPSKGPFLDVFHGMRLARRVSSPKKYKHDKCTRTKFVNSMIHPFIVGGRGGFLESIDIASLIFLLIT